MAPAQAADIPRKAPPFEPAMYTPTPWVNVFAGFSASPDSYFFDAGAVFALNRNLYRDGWLVRIRGGLGHYDYNRTPVLEQGVSWQTGEIMVGYQTFIGPTRLSGYIGANFEHHDNSDPTATVRGSKGGVRVQGEIYHPFADRWYLFALGTVSSVWSSYYVLGKVGYKITPTIAIGPEIAALGNDRFDAVRLGPFLAFDVNPTTQIIVSGGYQWQDDNRPFNDHSGGYFTIHARSNL
jgi:hypothetical protein